jgi:hypothetical protein
VLHAHSTEEALRARDVLGAIGVELDMPEAAVEVIFSGGAKSMDIRVPLEQADAATSAIEEAFGADRLPSKEDAKSSGDGPGPSLSEIEARAKEMEEEDERLRQEAEARRAARKDEPDEPEPEGETWVETIVYGVIAVGLLIGFVWLVSQM